MLQWTLWATDSNGMLSPIVLSCKVRVRSSFLRRCCSHIFAVICHSEFSPKESALRLSALSQRRCDSSQLHASRLPLTSHLLLSTFIAALCSLNCRVPPFELAFGLKIHMRTRLRVSCPVTDVNLVWFYMPQELCWELHLKISPLLVTIYIVVSTVGGSISRLFINSCLHHDVPIRPLSVSNPVY